MVSEKTLRSLLTDDRPAAASAGASPKPAKKKAPASVPGSDITAEGPGRVTVPPREASAPVKPPEVKPESASELEAAPPAAVKPEADKPEAVKPESVKPPKRSGSAAKGIVRPSLPAPPIPKILPSTGADRSLSPEEMQMERDRIYARLTSINNVIARPSPADYVVFEVADPTLVHKKLVALGIPPDVVQKYPKIPNGMRVFVRNARRNEEFIRALEQAAK